MADAAPNGPRKLGLIAGIGVGATVFYYQQVILRLSTIVGATVAPSLTLVHADLATVLHYVSRPEALACYLASFATQLERAGVELLAIAAIAPHICLHPLSELVKVPLVTPFEMLAKELRGRSVVRVAVFGSKSVMESRLFGMLPSRVEAVQLSLVDCQLIHRCYFDVVERTSADIHASLSEVRDTVNAAGARICQLENCTVILAATEFALLFQGGKPAFSCIDMADLHLDAIVSAMLRPR